MVVCIAGMHRSGTSMVARLLNLCGLDLGSPEELVPPAPDNPDGFWENIRFAGINTAVLKAFGGDWDVPPSMPEGWTASPMLAPLREMGRAVARRFHGREPWGWKDPRNSLTLPFWLGLIPDARIVVCVRHPIEVALSLQRRDGSPQAVGLRLWTTYYRRLLAAAPADRRVVTHYAAYFEDGAAELARVLDRLALPVLAPTVAAACRSIKPHLHHHRVPVSLLDTALVSADVLALYEALAMEAESPHLVKRLDRRRVGTDHALRA